MSLQSTLLKVEKPHYFHREYQNDLGIEDSETKSAINQGIRIVQAALPFLAIYKPAGTAITVVLGGCRTISSASQTAHSILEGEEQTKIVCEMLHTAVCIVSLGCIFFGHPLGMLVTTCHDLGINCIQMHQAWMENDAKKAREAGLHILNNSIYLGLFFISSSEALVTSLAFQILLGLYQSSEEFKKGNYLELFAGLLMVGIRVNQCTKPLIALQAKWQMKVLNNQLESLQVIEECNTAKSEIFANDSELVKGGKITPGSKQELIEVLLKYGKNGAGIPALHFAVQQQDIIAVKVLVEHGSEINLSAKAKTPIDYVIEVKNLEILQYLHSKGALIDARAVDTAANNGFLQGVIFLLKNGVPLPENSGELLYNVLKKDRLPERIEIVKSLIQFGADCSYTYTEYFPENLSSKDQMIPVKLGLLSLLQMGNGDFELVKLLVEGGASINYAMGGIFSKFDPNNPNNERMKLFEIDFNPLMRAVRNINSEITAYLLSKGAVCTEVHQKRFQDLVTQNYHHKLLQIMIKMNLVDTAQIQPLFEAVISWPFDYANSSSIEDAQLLIVKELFKRGALIKDEHLRQVLKSYVSKKELIAWLLDHGAKP